MQKMVGMKVVRVRRRHLLKLIPPGSKMVWAVLKPLGVNQRPKGHSSMNWSAKFSKAAFTTQAEFATAN
jgi:hypothetical protein